MLLLVLVPAAWAADMEPSRLVRAATRGKDPSTWFDADAAFVFEQRAAFGMTDFTGGMRARKLRDYLEDPDARRDHSETVASGGAGAIDGCKAGAMSQRWTASSGAAPELLLAWPARPRLAELGLAPLLCEADGAAAIGLTREEGGSWRIAAFLDTDGVEEWRGFADEAARDVAGEREVERARLTTELRAEVLSWSPPTLPVVKPNRDDVDGDGYTDVGAAGTHLYRSNTNAAELVNGAVKVLVAGDVDGDGVGDVLVDLGERLQLRLGGDAAKASLLQDGPTSSARWTAADLDGDGRADLVEVQSRSVRVWFDGRPYLGASLSLPAAAEAVAPAMDLDGDGVDDLAIGMPSFADQRGGVLIVHGVRGSPQPRTSGIVGGYKERLGERVSASAAGLLVGSWSGLTRQGRVDLWDGSGRLLRRDIAPGLLVEECPTIVAGPESGEVVAVCRSKLRRHGDMGVQELVFSALSGAAPAPIQTADGPRIAAWTRSSMNLLGGPDWQAGPTIPLPKPEPVALSPGGVVGGVIGGVIGGTVGDVAKLVHWSEVKMKRRPTPVFVPLPAGVTEDRCVVTVTLDGKGVPQRVAFKKCPEYLQETSRKAIMAAAWYPTTPPQPVQFDFNFVYRTK